MSVLPWSSSTFRPVRMFVASTAHGSGGPGVRRDGTRWVSVRTSQSPTNCTQAKPPVAQASVLRYTVLVGSLALRTSIVGSPGDRDDRKLLDTTTRLLSIVSTTQPCPTSAAVASL